MCRCLLSWIRAIEKTDFPPIFRRRNRNGHGTPFYAASQRQEVEGELSTCLNIRDAGFSWLDAGRSNQPSRTPERET